MDEMTKKLAETLRLNGHSSARSDNVARAISAFVDARIAEHEKKCHGQADALQPATPQAPERVWVTAWDIPMRAYFASVFNSEQYIRSDLLDAAKARIRELEQERDRLAAKVKVMEEGPVVGEIWYWNDYACEARKKHHFTEACEYYRTREACEAAHAKESK